MSDAKLKQRIATALDYFLSHSEALEIASMIIDPKNEPPHICRRIDEFCTVSPKREKHEETIEHQHRV